jgi:hypothetical protein
VSGSRSVIPEVPSRAFEFALLAFIGLIVVAILGLTAMIISLGREPYYFIMFFGFLPYLLASSGGWWWFRSRRLKAIAQRKKLIEALQNG